jgi:hypothetical protein
VTALVAWRFSLADVDVWHLGSYGLPPALPALWYAALALALVGAVSAICTPGAGTALAVAYVLLVALLLYGTVPALSPEPHYAWTYKHIGVVRYLEAHGRVDPRIDIYNRWPGFFALGAMLQALAGRTDPVAVADWAEAGFLMLDALAVMVAVRAVLGETRVAAGAALVFVLTNWVGQTYYSPQAFAFLLALALLAIALGHLRRSEGSCSARLGRLVGRVGRVPQLPATTPPQRWPRAAAVALVLLLDAVIVASHQLTPYMLLIGVALLMVVGVLRPWWLLAAMAAMTFAYLGLNLHFIQHNYGVFTSIDPFNNIYVEKFPATPTAGKVFNTDVQLLLIAATWLATAGASLRLLRCGVLMQALPFLVLALSPFAIVLGQNYGGEASLRIILFSSPWTGALIAWGLATVSRPRLRWTLWAATVVVFAALFVPSFLGQEELNMISPREVRASAWFYAHARRHSVLVLAAPGFPYRYGGSYPEYAGPEGDANPNLLQDAEFRGRRLGSRQLPAVAARIRQYAHHGYLAFTRDESAYAENLGITPAGALAGLEAAVRASRKFRLVYANPDAQIFELRAPAPGIGHVSRERARRSAVQRRRGRR